MTDVPPPPPPAQPPPGGGPYPARPTGPDAGSALSYGWEKFKTNAGPLIAVILIPVAAQIVLSLIGQFAGSLITLVLLSAVSYVVSLMLAIGVFNAGLMLTSGQPLDVGKAFSSDRWGDWILFSFVFGLFVGVGSLFCGVGALLVIAFWGLAPYYFLDQRMSLGEAFSAAFEKSKSTQGLPLALALVALVGFLGVIACGIGLLVTMPVAYVGAAFLYRTANAQPVAP